MGKEKELVKFLDKFVNKIEKNSLELYKAAWELETTGSKEAQKKTAKLDAKLSIIFSDKTTYKKLLQFEKDIKTYSEINQRRLSNLIRSFKGNMLPKDLIKKIADKSASLAKSYATFRADLDGKKLTENDILEVLKNENNVEIRKEYWKASKQISIVLAKQIIELVKLRNKAAKTLGYKNYYEMALDLQEVDKKWLLKTLGNLSKKSDESYKKTIDYIEEQLAKRFKVKREELGPWAWSDPFCQEDPLPKADADDLVKGKDIVEISRRFYKDLNIDVEGVLSKSDLYEKEGKNQHAFCISVDRKEDVRILCNVKESIRWTDTMLHELGHAIYDLGIDRNLPWDLRTPPHMITTEAMALLGGFQAYQEDFLKTYVTSDETKLKTVKEIRKSQARRQLIFSRWVMVMVNFEIYMYENPDKDLNKKWWELVEKYQLVKAPDRFKAQDWAAKYHVGLAPVYYHSYLLGEMFSSSLKDLFKKETGKASLVQNKRAGEILQEKVFKPGDKWHWNELVKRAIGKELDEDAWIKEFAK